MTFEVLLLIIPLIALDAVFVPSDTLPFLVVTTDIPLTRQSTLVVLVELDNISIQWRNAVRGSLG